MIKAISFVHFKMWDKSKKVLAKKKEVPFFENFLGVFSGVYSSGVIISTLTFSDTCEVSSIITCSIGSLFS